MSSVIRGRAAGGGGSWSEGRSGDVSAIAVRQGGCIKGWRDLWPKIEAARPREGRTLDSYLSETTRSPQRAVHWGDKL